ncbi:MAG: DUF3574 domain-containing protein [Bacteroidia bacterium]
MRFIPFIVVLLFLTACVSTVPLRKGALIKTELYFGMNIPGGGEVGPTEWAQFLGEEVTPRFSDGLTVFQAQGQWLGEDSVIAREQSRVVVLLYTYSEAREADIQALMAAYKKRFRQEAVMRVDSKIRLGFY